MANILHLFKCFKMAKVQTENKKRHFKSILFFSAQTFVCFKFSKRLPCKCITLLLRGECKVTEQDREKWGDRRRRCVRGMVWLAGWLALQNDLNNKWLSPYHVGPFVLIIIMQYKWTRERFVRRAFVLAHKLTRVDGSKARSFACLLWMRHGTYYYYYYFTIFDALYWMNNER